MSAATETHGSRGAQGSHGTMSQLMIGFALAALLTIVPFVLVMHGVAISRPTLIGIIMALGAAQIIVHLVFFLHVNAKAEAGWTLAATLFAVIILGIVLAGSLWVMHNMNANMMPPMGPMQMDRMMSLQGQQG